MYFNFLNLFTTFYKNRIKTKKYFIYHFRLNCMRSSLNLSQTKCILKKKVIPT